MQPYQQRVIDEKRDLDEKISKLVEFIGLPTFQELPIAEKHRMTRQITAMCAYSNILEERIDAFSID